MWIKVKLLNVVGFRRYLLNNAFACVPERDRERELEI